MAEQKKENEDTRNWVKNAEEHGRISEQIVKLTVQLDALTKIVDKLTEGQKDLRAKLVGDIKDTNARDDKLREELTLERIERNYRFEESLTRFAKQAEKNKKEIKNENRWLKGTILAFLVVMFAVLAHISGG